MVLALLVHQRVTNPAGTPAAPWSSLSRRVAGIAVARLVVPAVLVPVALVGSLVGVLAVVLVLAGGITVAARVTGLG